MTHTIISKRTTPFVYTNWAKINGQFHQQGRGIVINGGAGVVGGDQLLSGIPLEHRLTLIPESVLTFVDDEALAALMKNPKFQKDLKRGIVQVVKGKISQSKGDNIAKSDMLENEHIPTRPITAEEMEAAGGVMTKDGNVDISEVSDDTSPLKLRKQEAGLPGYEKKSRRETRKRLAKERKSGK